MYTDTLIVFHAQGGESKATVWHRGFPQGRQRRKQVAGTHARAAIHAYRFDKPGKPRIDRHSLIGV